MGCMENAINDLHGLNQDKVFNTESYNDSLLDTVKRGIENAELLYAAKCVLENYDVKSGPREHYLGCECTLTREGEIACAAFRASLEALRVASDKIISRDLS